MPPPSADQASCFCSACNANSAVLPCHHQLAVCNPPPVCATRASAQRVNRYSTKHVCCMHCTSCRWGVTKREHTGQDTNTNTAPQHGEMEDPVPLVANTHTHNTTKGGGGSNAAHQGTLHGDKCTHTRARTMQALCRGPQQHDVCCCAGLVSVGAHARSKKLFLQRPHAIATHTLFFPFSCGKCHTAVPNKPDVLSKGPTNTTAQQPLKRETCKTCAMYICSTVGAC